MKKLIIGTIATLTFLTCFSFKTVHEILNSTANVEKVNDLYVFGFSKPEKEYTIIGEVKNGRMTNNEFFLVPRTLTEYAIKTYPTADAIIIKNDAGFMKKGIYAEVIQFK